MLHPQVRCVLAPWSVVRHVHLTSLMAVAVFCLYGVEWWAASATAIRDGHPLVALPLTEPSLTPPLGGRFPQRVQPWRPITKGTKTSHPKTVQPR